MQKTLIFFIGFVLMFMGGFFLYASYEMGGIITPSLIPSDKSIAISLPEVSRENGTGRIRNNQLSKVHEVLPCIRNPNVLFFMYHYIRDDDPLDTTITHNLSIPPSVFDAQMAIVERLAKNGNITLINGSDFLSALNSVCYPEKQIWIFTDDDGWRDAYENLMPIAANHRVPFFFGIIGNRVDTSGFVTSGEVRALGDNPLFTISSHSLTHDDESKMSVEKEHREMCESKKILENITGKPVNSYIYPSGRMNASGSTENLKSCGYSLAWTTSFGKDFDLKDPHFSEINRIRVGRDDGEAFFEKYIQRY